MPHCILYSPNKCSAEMLSSVHQAMNDSGLFSEDRIKVRVIPTDSMMLTGGKSQAHLTVEIKLLQGRNAAQKADLAQRVMQACKLHTQLPLSVEVIDLSSEYWAD